jgi:hypothetical protein
MNINELLARLKKLKVDVDEERKLADGRRILILTSLLDFFPLAPHRRWYSLVMEAEQEEVPEEEAEAILRHFWHAEIEWFKND